MNPTPQREQVWEYGHPGPEMRVVEITRAGIVYLMGVPHPSLHPDTICPVITSTLERMKASPWRFLRAPSTKEPKP